MGTLVGLVIVVGMWLYSRKLKRDIDRIRADNDRKRAELADVCAQLARFDRRRP